MRGRWDKGRGQPPDFSVAPPATTLDVDLVETSLGCPLPTAFREVVLEYSASVSVLWQLPDEVGMPEEFELIFAGECRWDLLGLPALFAEHQDWLTNCFSNPDDDYDAIWHAKFPILQVGNGDMIAIDPVAQGQPVVYLSHDDGAAHGYRLGENFVDYIDRLSRLGCPGAEDWQWLMFVDGPSSGLLVDSPTGTRWRQWLGIH
jgi:hypothetical protein